MHISMISRLITTLGLLVGLASVLACAEATDEASMTASGASSHAHHQADYADLEDGPHADHLAAQSVVIYDADSADQYFNDDGVVRFDFEESFVQVGWMMDADDASAMSYRTQSRNGDWSDWHKADVYWSEATLHNAHIVLLEPTKTIEIRGIEGLEFADIAFSDEVTARAEQVGDGVEDQSDDDDVATVSQAVAPSSMVTTRYQWGATSPGKVCGSVVAPYRASIHHTAVPSSDGGDPHARMRQMQSYHMNTNGWCDIGYHFVVAQSGEIMQGRSHSDRPAAHVGGQNWGNVGISMIGNYTSSNPPQIQLDGVSDMVAWVHNTHGVPLDRNSIRGHREWPGQTTSCPGDVGLSHLDDIIENAGKPSGPSAEYDVDVSVVIDGLDDFYTQGSSDSVPDAFAGETFRAGLRITNNSTEPIRGVQLGYAFDQVGLEATHYVIESDHPAYDQSSWQLNSADEDEGNPDRDALGAGGSLIMHAFSPGETKRVLVDLETTEYNIGFRDFWGIQAWVENIEDVYGVQSSYGQAPGTDHTQGSGLLQDQHRVDVLSRNEWRFQAGHRQDLEGWIGGGEYEDLAINTNHDLLAQQINGSRAYADSPSWTRVDADRFDEMVIRVRSHDGDHLKGLYWSSGDGPFDQDRAVYFNAPGDSDYHTLVVPVGDHPEWNGEIPQLRVVLYDGQAPTDEDSRWHDIDHIYFQDFERTETSSASLGVVEQTPVDISFEESDDSSGASEDSDDTGSSSQGFPGAADDGNIETKGGCSAAGGSNEPPAGWLLVALVALGFVAVGRQNDD